MNTAPIILFVYNRPRHTEQTLRALSENKLADVSTLYIYSDGPKHLALEEDLEKIVQVRNLIKRKQWCRKVEIIETEWNRGLADSILAGVSEVINKHGRVIVLEDDLVTSPGFLTYMNDALDLYHDDQSVMHISGYMYPAEFESNVETFFLNILSCWGWATWKDAWQHYQHDVQDHYSYFNSDKVRKKKFDIEGNGYFFKQLEKNANQELYSWAVRWYASWLRASGYSLFPSHSLVENIGHDGTGVHCTTQNAFMVKPVDSIIVEKIPIQEDQNIRSSVDRFFQQKIQPSNQKNHLTTIYFILKILGIKKLRDIMRFIGKKIFPELAFLENNFSDLKHLRSTIKDTEIGQHVKYYEPFHINHSQIGDYTYISSKSWITHTTIGKFCSIGPNLVCGWGVHPVDSLSTAPMFYSSLRQNGMTLSQHDKVQERKPITIGNDVFIGMNVTILDGVTIGDGAVIGAGAVVSKHIPPYAIAVGNPIRVLRYRFRNDIIEKLHRIKWWDFDETQLQDVERYCFDVEKFVNKYS